MITKYCKGCGVLLQNDDPQKEGYVVREEMEYCQRCFKMRHYNQQILFEQQISEEKVFDLLKQQEGHFIWIIDSIDLETALNSSFAGFLKDKSFSVIINKLDMFPLGVRTERIVSYVSYRLNEMHLHVENILTRGDGSDFRASFRDCFSDKTCNLILIGLANSGKSTVINDLLGEEILTVNRNPATTLNVNRIDFEEMKLVDTVGLKSERSMVSYLTDRQLRTVVPVNRIRPQIYQIYEDQTLLIGGLVRIDVFGPSDFSAVFNISNLLKVHRGSTEKADRNFVNPHMVPKLKEKEKLKKITVSWRREKRDICISGLGFISISGRFRQIDIYVDERISVYLRKAMI